MTGAKQNSSDRLIADLIRRYPGAERYDDLITDRNVQFFSHLSSLRESLLAWFPFDRCGTVLEIGGEFGALTGIPSQRFGRADVIEPDPLRAEAIGIRYRNRSNIRIFNMTADRFASPEKYDAVILADLTRTCCARTEDLFEKLSSLIRDDGVVLLGFKNRNAARYLCGYLDQYVTVPFETSALYSKPEITAALAGRFPFIKWYYPLPDERFVQAVYTDDSDFSTLSDRVFFFDGYASPFIQDEKEMMMEFVRNGTVCEHADYCLAELRKTAKDNAITEVYLSADREDGRRYRLTLTEDSVIKSPLDSQSAAALAQEHQNLETLKARGISTVDETFTDGVIRMPRIKSRSLMSVIGDIDSKEELAGLFDLLYRNILLSSEETSKGVLKTGYIDMIPFNIFCDEGNLIYYDQEFTKENCDAAYIMFRALHYSWLHEPGLEQIIPLEEMKQRFMISSEKWASYEESEADFVSRNRRHHTFEQVYRWAYMIPPDQMQKNRIRLLGYDPDKIRAVQQVGLDILKHFLVFCRQNDLSCFALHGTMLGAVRNGGLIPWDDDIDIGMKREDYDRLISLYDNENHYPYFLQTMVNNKGVFYGGYAKLRREDTAGIEPYNRYHGGSLGIAIDIFPLDYCDEDPEKRAEQQRHISILQRLLFAKRYPDHTELISDVPGKYLSLYYILARVIPKRLLFFLLEKSFRRIKQSGKRAILACYYKFMKNRNIYDERDLNDLTEFPFEGMMIPVMKNADLYLRQRFGPDYMTDPAERKPKHSDVLYDTAKSYKDYQGWT